MTPHSQPMTAEQIERIRERAEKSTLTKDRAYRNWFPSKMLHEVSGYSIPDSDFISICDPQTILALCELAAKGLAAQEGER